jgi:hypothetical protein
MDDPLDAAPLDDAHDPRVVNASAAESLRYRMLVRLLMAHDRSFEPPASDPVHDLADRIAEVERRCAAVLRRLHPDEAERLAPMFPIDLRAH